MEDLRKWNECVNGASGDGAAAYHGCWRPKKSHWPAAQRKPCGFYRDEDALCVLCDVVSGCRRVMVSGVSGRFRGLLSSEGELR